MPLLKKIIALLIFYCLFTGIQAASNLDPEFSDSPLEEAIILPDWFKLSFLELASDVQEAKEKHKKGIIVYFSQEYCPYCKAHLENNWGQKDIIDYTQKYFDVIAINVKGQKTVVDLDGKSYTEKSFAAHMHTNFTPSIVFYNTEGKIVLRLRGYRPPYQFRAALEYVAGDHYKHEPYSHYLARAETAMAYGKKELNFNEAFSQPPYLLDRSNIIAERPLMVAFERKHCHACDILHGGPLSHPEIEKQLLKMDAVQLDINSDTPVITPAGEKTSAKKWAKELEIDYTPTMIFYDQKGKEIIRIDSVVWFYRLRNVMNYVLSGGYKKYPTFQLWRQSKNMR